MRIGDAVVTCCSMRFGLLCSGLLSTANAGRPVRLAWVSATTAEPCLMSCVQAALREERMSPTWKLGRLPSKISKNQSKSLHNLSVGEFVSNNHTESSPGISEQFLWGSF